MSFNQKEIGQRVNELRTGHQLSLDQLADAVNCTRDHLYRADRGEPRHGFSIDILIEIARYFDVSLDYLILGCRIRKNGMTNPKSPARSQVTHP